MSTLKVDDIQSRQSTDDAISLASDSSVSLKHSASAKLTTTSTGVTVTGTCTATAFSGDGSALTGLSSGLSSDAQRNVVGGTDAGVSFSGTSAQDNTLIGHNAGNAITTGDGNICVGAFAGFKSTTAISNVFVGRYAGQENISGNYNIGIGVSSLLRITSGANNVAIGRECAEDLTTADNNVFIGGYAGSVMTTGSASVFIGYEAGKASTTQVNQVHIGYKAGLNMNGSHGNVLIGADVARNQTTGGNNVAIGPDALLGASGGSAGNRNTAVGYQCGININNSSTGDNTFLGARCGYNVTSGTNNLCLGYQAGQSSSPSGTITTGSNNVVLGNNSITNIYCADTTISSSDQRDKTDITSFNLGLAWVEALRPVTYRWDRRTWYGTDEQPYGTPDGSKKRTQLHVGFLAQEALEVEKANGYGTSNDDSITVHLNEDEMSYGMKYERLVPILVNAIKELSTKNNALEARIQTLETA